MKKLLFILISFIFITPILAEWPPCPWSIQTVTDWPDPSIFTKIAERKIVRPVSKIRAYFFTLGTLCSPCMEIKPTIEELQKEGWQIKTLDANEYIEWYKEYEIEGTPTILILEEYEKEVKVLERISGVKSKDFLENIFRKHKVQGKLTPNEAAEILSRGGLSNEEAKELGKIIDQPYIETVTHRWSAGTCGMLGCTIHGAQYIDIHKDGSETIAKEQPGGLYSSGRCRRR